LDEIIKISAGILYGNLLTLMFLYGCWQVRGMSMDEAGDKYAALGCIIFPLATAAVTFIAFS